MMLVELMKSTEGPKSKGTIPYRNNSVLDNPSTTKFSTLVLLVGYRDFGLKSATLTFNDFL